MAIKIKKNGKIEQFTLHSTDVKVLDLEGKFKKKDLESVIREISDTEHIHIGEVDTTKDGIWIDDGETLDNSENNGVVERLKEYVDNKIELVKFVNVEVDFNELEDGRYFINTTKESLKNAPNSVSHGGILTVNRCSEGLSQILISDEDRVYYRKKWYVYWSEWNELMSANQISNPNLLINGDFQVWQRGDYFKGHGLYTADRWRYDQEGEEVSISRHPDGGLVLTNETNKRIWLQQYIELSTVEQQLALSNKMLTLSFNVYTDESSINPYAIIATGEDYSEIFKKQYNITSASESIGKKISITFNTGDLIGKPYIAVILYRIDDTNKSETTTGKRVRFTNVKLEVGSVATPFISRLYDEELALCQRYYEVIDRVFRTTGFSLDSGAFAIEYPFLVEKRTPPTVVLPSDKTDTIEILFARNDTPTNLECFTTIGGVRFTGSLSNAVNRIVGLNFRTYADAEIY